MFNQVIGNGTALFQADEWSKNPSAPDSDLYSILDQLETLRDAPGDPFVFKMVWPGAFEGATISSTWSQTR